MLEDVKANTWTHPPVRKDVPSLHAKTAPFDGRQGPDVELETRIQSPFRENESTSNAVEAEEPLPLATTQTTLAEESLIKYQTAVTDASPPVWEYVQHTAIEVEDTQESLPLMATSRQPLQEEGATAHSPVPGGPELAIAGDETEELIYVAYLATFMNPLDSPTGLEGDVPPNHDRAGRGASHTAGSGHHIFERGCNHYKFMASTQGAGLVRACCPGGGPQRDPISGHHHHHVGPDGPGGPPRDPNPDVTKHRHCRSPSLKREMDHYWITRVGEPQELRPRVCGDPTGDQNRATEGGKCQHVLVAFHSGRVTRRVAVEAQPEVQVPYSNPPGPDENRPPTEAPYLMHNYPVKRTTPQSKYSTRSSFSDFAQKHGKDERFKNIEKMRERESLFNEFLLEVRKREKEEKVMRREQDETILLQELTTYLLQTQHEQNMCHRFVKNGRITCGNG
ncbi:hypothetical protein PR048_001656 [Dryococelus australis]|uniref:FF domain-containing protein n=1 Tax=Dryococelus australis TaxID=614101 RepID=A0ABQ9IHY0_9NEOP|nr:hypothetical protein PR048_001656 [Dryococelus australis]